jgi:oligoendopeptidase F
VASALEDAALEQAAWDLEPLVDGAGEAGVRERLGEAIVLADDFQARHAGRVAELDVAGLVAAMRELEVIHELLARAGYYAALRFSTDTADPARGALLQHVQEQETRAATSLLFFELEWAALDADHAERLLDDPALEFCAHHLRGVRRYRDHLLGEGEEKIVAEKNVTGAGAWSRLFEELTSAIEVTLPEAAPVASPAALDVALSLLQSPDRELRRQVAESISAALEPGLRTRAFVLNTLLADKSTDDRLRHYPTWLSARNLANEASDASVAALVEAVRERYEIARRWYRLKARVLGIEQLADYDRMAAVTSDEKTYRYAEAQALVVDCYESFAPELGALARRFFDEHHIDAPVRPGKRGGAFCASAVPTVYPYVMLNYTSQRRDVLTMAHELGHGVHFALAAGQGTFHQSTPLTLAETASVFGEQIVFGRLLDEDSDPASRFSLLAANLEDMIATVFRQVAMNQFEALIHTARRDEGELSVEQIGELWARSQAELLGDSVQITDGYRSWWSYVPHLIGMPGYVYAYAYGLLLSLSVYDRYRRLGQEVVPGYLEMLAAGGSKAPEQVAALVGIDLEDPGFWSAGLDLVEARLVEAEAAARAAGAV